MRCFAPARGQFKRIYQDSASVHFPAWCLVRLFVRHINAKIWTVGKCARNVAPYGIRGDTSSHPPRSWLSCGFSYSFKQNRSSMAQDSSQRRLYCMTWWFYILLTYNDSGNNLPAFFFFKFREHKMNLSYSEFSSQKNQRGKRRVTLGV